MKEKTSHNKKRKKKETSSVFENIPNDHFFLFLELYFLLIEKERNTLEMPIGLFMSLEFTNDVSKIYFECYQQEKNNSQKTN